MENATKSFDILATSLSV